ncbi:hypothetical protein TEA_022648 [Camellia sinensis var. sinensis]|uniref:Uncharacterized protein n=1 Tax=Camellia sinensis var. sinensis TaxID=542762 RepID=A0A4S4DQF3_CAMSN|nr:hypothetical protein TEA_022648 [Camellia sinensis var. sinensis]
MGSFLGGFVLPSLLLAAALLNWSLISFVDLVAFLLIRFTAPKRGISTILIGCVWIMDLLGIWKRERKRLLSGHMMWRNTSMLSQRVRNTQEKARGKFKAPTRPWKKPEDTQMGVGLSRKTLGWVSAGLKPSREESEELNRP